MKLLLTLMALMIGWLAGRQLRDLKHGLIHRWFVTLLGHGNSPVRPLVLVLIPGLAIAVVHLYLVSHGHVFPAAGVSLVALVFAWGSRDLDADVQQYLEAADPEQKQLAAGRLVLAEAMPVTANTGNESDPDVSTVEPSAPESAAEPPGDGPVVAPVVALVFAPGQVVEGVFYQALARWFGALFWFLVAGPGGAVAFRFLHALLSEQRNFALLTPSQQYVGRRWLALIDWPAAFLAALGLAIVGDFDRVVRGARRLARESGWRSLALNIWPKVGAMTVISAPDDAFEHEFSGASGEVNIAMNLVWRVLACWLTVAALVTVVTVLNN